MTFIEISTMAAFVHHPTTTPRTAPPAADAASRTLLSSSNPILKN